ncbi:Glycerate 2-kinase [Mannheimia haemolytica]
MKIVIAPDSFKESLTALEVAQAIQQGFARVFPEAEYQLVPMADGGEGSVQSLVDATHGSLQKISVIAPLANEVEGFLACRGIKKPPLLKWRRQVACI